MQTFKEALQSQTAEFVSLGLLLVIEGLYMWSEVKNTELGKVLISDQQKQKIRGEMPLANSIQLLDSHAIVQIVMILILLIGLTGELTRQRYHVAAIAGMILIPAVAAFFFRLRRLKF
jgi:high-affinity Fe2+/Pb2+ permease